MEGFSTPNLDDIPFEDLVEVHKVYRRLTEYCELKQHARELRTQGRIALAQIHERHCEHHYSRLPAWARW